MLDPRTEEIKIMLVIMYNVIIALTEGIQREECPRSVFLAQDSRLKIHQEFHELMSYCGHVYSWYEYYSQTQV